MPKFEPNISKGARRTIGPIERHVSVSDPRNVNERVPVDGSVTSEKIPSDTINGGHILPLAVNNEHVQSNAIGPENLSADSVLRSKIAPAAVGSEEIGDSQVLAVHLNFDPATQGELIFETDRLWDAKSNTGHGHAWSDINNPPSTFNPDVHASGKHTGTIGSRFQISSFQHADSDHSSCYSFCGHSHSTSQGLRFEALDKSSRDKLLKARSMVSRALSDDAKISEEELKAMRMLMLGMFHISFDGLTETAEERMERRDNSQEYEEFIGKKVVEMYGAEVREGTTVKVDDMELPPAQGSITSVERLLDARSKMGKAQMGTPRFAKPNEQHPDLRVDL
jgi:hypothetical protein